MDTFLPSFISLEYLGNYFAPFNMNGTKIDRIFSIPSWNDKDEESRRHLSSQKDTQFNNPKYTIIPKYLN